jgi:hypothetical protein
MHLAKGLEFGAVILSRWETRSRLILVSSCAEKP